MYTPYISIILGIISVFVVPVIYYTYLQKKKSKKIIQNFSQLARMQDLHLDFAESMPNLLIGLDTTARKLFIVQSGISDEEEQVATLEEITSCEIETSRSAPSREITQIALHLGNKARADQKIIFYNAGLEVHPDAERRMEAAEKWKRIISANIGIPKS